VRGVEGHGLITLSREKREGKIGGILRARGKRGSPQQVKQRGLCQNCCVRAFWLAQMEKALGPIIPFGVQGSIIDL